MKMNMILGLVAVCLGFSTVVRAEFVSGGTPSRQNVRPYPMPRVIPSPPVNQPRYVPVQPVYVAPNTVMVGRWDYVVNGRMVSQPVTIVQPPVYQAPVYQPVPMYQPSPYTAPVYNNAPTYAPCSRAFVSGNVGGYSGGYSGYLGGCAPVRVYAPRPVIVIPLPFIRIRIH